MARPVCASLESGTKEEENPVLPITTVATPVTLETGGCHAMAVDVRGSWLNNICNKQEHTI